MRKVFNLCLLFTAFFTTLNTARAQELEDIGDWSFYTDQVQVCGLVNKGIYIESDFNGFDERQIKHYGALIDQGQISLFRPVFEILAANFDGVTGAGASLYDKRFDFKENETAEVLLQFDDNKTEKLTGHAVEKIMAVGNQYTSELLEVEPLNRSDILSFPVSPFLKDTVPNMKKANYVSVFVNGAYFGEISLKGFTKTFNRVEECIKHDLKDIYDPF